MASSIPGGTTQSEIDKMNPYYESLFNSFNHYITSITPAVDEALMPNNKDYMLVKPNNAIGQTAKYRIVYFNNGSRAQSAYSINTIGDYNYIATVPYNMNFRPNYVGTLYENGKLNADTDNGINVMRELLSFANNVEKKETVKDTISWGFCRGVGDIYKNLYLNKDQQQVADSYYINFTNGMPYDLSQHQFEKLHMDVVKEFNEIIHHAIETGQTAATEHYSASLTDLWRKMFFNGKSARFHVLDTGMLPSAVDMCYKLAGLNTTWKDDLEYISAGKFFLPDGVDGSQFTGIKGTKRWYPFYTPAPYQYYYDGKQFIKDTGFDHTVYDQKIVSAAEATTQEEKAKITTADKAGNTEKLNTVLRNDIPSTQILNQILMGTAEVGCTKDISTSPTMLSMLSSQSYLKKIASIEEYTRPPTFDVNNNRKFTVLGPFKKIENWAHVPIYSTDNKDAISDYILHPLLNRYANIDAAEGKRLLDFTVEDPPKDFLAAYNTPDVYSRAELDYYNHTMPINTRSLRHDMMNYYGKYIKPDTVSDLNGTVEGVDWKSLTFARISSHVWAPAAGGTVLSPDQKKMIKRGIFGIATEVKKSDGWKTLKLGFTSKLDVERPDELTDRLKLLAKADPMPTVRLHWRYMVYNGERKGSGACKTLRRSANNGNDIESADIRFDGVQSYKMDLPEKSNLYKFAASVNNLETIPSFYFTIHLLAQDGRVTDLKIDTTLGYPDFSKEGASRVTFMRRDDNGKIIAETDTQEARQSRYGTGIQYFFAGYNCEDIYRKYEEQGLTMDQLLSTLSKDDILKNPSDDREDRSNRYSRVYGGLRFANVVFRWDYKLLLNAWATAKGVIFGNLYSRGMNDGAKIWHTENAGIALAVFFEAIYNANINSPTHVFIGKSLRGINDEVGPFGGANNSLVDFKGAVYKTIMSRGNVGSYGGQGAMIQKTANSIFCAANIPKYVFVAPNGTETHGPDMYDGTGVHEQYYREGPWWGQNNCGDFFDHFKWGWNIGKTPFNVFSEYAHNCTDEDRVCGCFLLSESMNKEANTSPAKARWETMPFHDVSPYSRTVSDLFGTRTSVRGRHCSGDRCETRSTSNSAGEKGEVCNIHYTGWFGIVGVTEADFGFGRTEGNCTNHGQNPNIRVRLPMLWRYLTALRSRNIYTDGQLMPVGAELHYREAHKSLLSSFNNLDRPFMNIGVRKSMIDDSKMGEYKDAIVDPAATVVAETIKNTYAVSRRTMAKWYNVINDPEMSDMAIRNILQRVDQKRDLITSLYRTQKYTQTLPEDWKVNGTMIGGLPILPFIATMGAKTTPDNDCRRTYASNIRVAYEDDHKPLIEKKDGKAINCSSVGIGVCSLPGGEREASSFIEAYHNCFNEFIGGDPNCIGFIIPVPVKSNESLSSSAVVDWRYGLPSVIPLYEKEFMQGNTLIPDANTKIDQINQLRVDWVGWVLKRAIDSLHNCKKFDDNNPTAFMESNSCVKIQTPKFTIAPEMNDKDPTTPFTVTVDFNAYSTDSPETTYYMIAKPYIDENTRNYDIRNIFTDYKLGSDYGEKNIPVFRPLMTVLDYHGDQKISSDLMPDLDK